MLKQRNVLIVLLPLLLIGFVFGLARLFQLRLEHGDIYPPYSSLRADPLGTKIFYKSLQKLRGIDAARLYEPLRKVESGRDKTLFLLGTSPGSLAQVPRADVDEIETFARNGGCVVIALPPISTKNWQMRRGEKDLREKREAEKKDQKKSPSKKKIKSEEDEADSKIVSLFEEWSLSHAVSDLETDDEGVAQPVRVTRVSEDVSLPSEIPWHSGFYFHDLTNQWREIFQRETNQAVVIERSFGQGRIILATDSYLFSNEAMRHHRQSLLLAWFMGGNHGMLFDETHLGVAADPGIATLARKYRLHGLVGGLLLLAGLF
ncbi:MAG: DUF4350 domain-containing protein, partial [Verrucomicrobiota bacterium]